MDIKRTVKSEHNSLVKNVEKICKQINGMCLINKTQKWNRLIRKWHSKYGRWQAYLKIIQKNSMQFWWSGGCLLHYITSNTHNTHFCTWTIGSQKWSAQIVFCVEGVWAFRIKLLNLHYEPSSTSFYPTVFTRFIKKCTTKQENSE